MRDFQHGSWHLVQDLFRAETPDHILAVTYDDVEKGIELHVTWKNRWTQNDVFGAQPKRVTLKFGDVNAAIIRAMNFIADHPQPQPYCSVDY